MTDSTAQLHPAPNFYRIGTTKLVAMSLCTLGLFSLLWFWMQWDAIRVQSGEKFSAGFRAFFSVFTAHALFRRIHESLVADGATPDFQPGASALAYIALAICWRLPKPYWLIGLFWFAPVIQVQAAINRNVRRHDRDADLNEGWEWWSFLLASVGGVLLLLALVGTFLPEAGK